MAPIDEAIVILKSTGNLNVFEVARESKIERSTLSKRFCGKRGSVAKASETEQLLSNKQGVVPVNNIQRLCD